MHSLVTNDALIAKLNEYMLKTMMSGTQINDANHVPTSALIYSMQQAIAKNTTDIATLNTNAFTLKTDKKIPVNADMDTYKDIGIYACDENATAITLKNCKLQIAFMLIVMRPIKYENKESSYRAQIYYPYILSLTNNIWSRSTNDNGEWQPYCKIVLAADS